MAARFSFGEIVKATGGIPAGAATAENAVSVTGVSTDTRTLHTGDAFFALIGENHDAHDHLDEAAAKGAALLAVSDASKVPAGFAGAVLVTEDTLRAYQELAAYYRQKIDPLVIAVTGSVGKTTTKDMIGCVLTNKARVSYTRGNLNNHIGLPRTILEAEEDTEILVVEMGMSLAGEIKRLCEIALPDVAVITNIGISHREGFDSDDGILYAKYEIASFLGEGGALIIDAGGYPKLEKLAAEGRREKGFDLLRVAAEGTAAAEYADYIVYGTRVSEEDPAVSLFGIRERQENEAVDFSVPVPGAYIGMSAALASAACSRAGAGLKDASKALMSLKRTAHRLDPAVINGVILIDDTYNASPDSAKSGLEYLKNLKTEKRIAVLADMLGLGVMTEAMHREIGAAAVNAGADRIYAYGDNARWIAEGAEEAAAGIGDAPETYYYGPEEKEEMIKQLRKVARKGSAIYVKGSNAMKMVEVVTALMGYAAETEDGDDPY